MMVFSTAYFPPISYFQKIVSSDVITLEKHEHFVKQTWRNRCHILGANGVQVLSVPLVNTHEKTLITEKRIAYIEKWQNQHWRSIESAYRNSPYFIYYEDELKVFFENEFEFLFEYNTDIFKLLLKLLKIELKLQFTSAFEREVEQDLRNSILPKGTTNSNQKPYTQVFSDKHGFLADLSILDLLFNKGPDSVEYLRS